MERILPVSTFIPAVRLNVVCKERSEAESGVFFRHQVYCESEVDANNVVNELSKQYTIVSWSTQVVR